MYGFLVHQTRGHALIRALLWMEQKWNRRTRDVLEEGDTNVLLMVELTLANPLQEHTKSPHPLMDSVPPIMAKKNTCKNPIAGSG